MIINSLINQGSEILKRQQISSYQIDAELLLSEVIRKDRVYILTNGERKISFREKSDYFSLINRRKAFEPLSYITGKKEFWSSNFYVNNNVLIPRPETELIVHQVLKKFEKKNNLNILDIGTGSGCILLSILKELTNSKGVGIDISLKALNIAIKNSSKLNLTKRAKFVHCDIDNYIFDNYDVVVSNPPYICSHEMRYLSENVKDFEPRLALDGGKSGIEVINKVIVKAKKLLKVKGCLYLEIGDNQFEKVSSMLADNGFKLMKRFFDYSNIIRCIMSTKVN